MGNTESRIVSEDTEIKKFSHFPAADVKEWSNYFKTNFNNSVMSIYEMENLFKMLFPLGHVEGFSSRLFRTINIGQTGLVDFNELLIAFSILVKGSNFERLRWIFRFYDQDKDGVVSKHELTEGVEDMIKMVEGTFECSINTRQCVDDIFTAAENESGFLTFNDFERLSESKDCCFKLFPLILE